MNIFELQTGLNVLEAPRVRVDGVWGANSKTSARALMKRLGVKLKATADLQVAVMQAMLKHIGNVPTGPIDGFIGPITAKALQNWENSGFRDVVMEPVHSDVRFPKSLNIWPRYRDIEEFYGKPGTKNVRISLPFEKRLAWDIGKTIHKISINERCAESYVRVQRELLHVYGLKQLRALRIDVTGGIFNNRPMRGGTRKSTHAYACAEDIDPINNRLRDGRDKASLAGADYDDMWGIWTAEGWTSLGKARNFDWMHVQACRL